MGNNLMQASNEWANRPLDERFWSITDLLNHLRAERNATVVLEKIPLHGITVMDQGGQLVVMGPQRKAALAPNHWSFGQLCVKTSAPGSYLRTLPPKLAAECLNHNIQQTEDRPMNILMKKGNTLPMVRAFTGTETYGRLFDEQICKQLEPALAKGWMTPPARPMQGDPRARPATKADIVPNQGNFGLAVKVGDMIGPAGVYRGDRNMFLFVIHPNRIIADNGKGGLMRGIFLWNSEVGDKSLGGMVFLFDNVCGNHIVWDVSGTTLFRYVHRKFVTTRFEQQFIPELTKHLGEYADQSASPEETMIKRARKFVIGKDRQEVIDVLYADRKLGLSQKDIGASYDMAVEYEDTAGAPPTTAWGLVHGLTRYSQTTGYADSRQKLDAAGGLILAKAA